VVPGGDALYGSWTAAADDAGGKRISALHHSEVVKIEATVEAGAGRDEKIVKHLRLRNNQLARMIQHVASFVFYTEQDDIDQNSTSLEWIFSYLQRHYNIEARGANFLNITEHTFTAGTSPQVFYKQFRASFLSNLRKTNDKTEHKGPGKVLTADEGLSPSFEDTIVLWTLEKIDPRLPKKVKKDYEHRLDNATYLIDIQATVFQAIPAMLEDLEKEAGLSAMSANHAKYERKYDGETKYEEEYETGGDTFMNAVRVNNGRGARGARGARGQAGGGGRRGRGGGTGLRRPWTEKFCRVCHSAGKQESVYAAHNTAFCPLFDNGERQSLFTDLGAMGMGEESGEDWDGPAEERDQEEEDGRA
jgi:hypothetical protein